RQFPAADGSADRSICRPIFVARRGYDGAAIWPVNPVARPFYVNLHDPLRIRANDAFPQQSLSLPRAATRRYFGQNPAEPSKVGILTIWVQSFGLCLTSFSDRGINERGPRFTCHRRGQKAKAISW